MWYIAVYTYTRASIYSQLSYFTRPGGMSDDGYLFLITSIALLMAVRVPIPNSNFQISRHVFNPRDKHTTIRANLSHYVWQSLYIYEKGRRRKTHKRKKPDLLQKNTHLTLLNNKTRQGTGRNKVVCIHCIAVGDPVIKKGGLRSH